MADVRSLLRSERTARKINHRHALYSSTGQLSCSVCRIPIKSETFWDSHMRSASHVSAAKKAVRLAASSSTELVSRKRKASEEEEEDQIRKRTKAEDESPPATKHDALHQNAPQESLQDVIEDAVKPTVTDITRVEQAEVNEDEWTAFERDIDELNMPPPTSKQNLSVFQAVPTISAQALSATEIAAQAREEQSVQKGRREEEIEEEQEEASRQMEDEFEHMAQLDEKMRALRERRESLRMLSKVNQKTTIPSELVEAVQEVSDDEISDDELDDAWAGFNAR